MANDTVPAAVPTVTDEIPEQVFTDAANVYATQIIGVAKPASKIAKEKWLRLIVASAYAAGLAAAEAKAEDTTGGEWQWGFRRFGRDSWEGTEEIARRLHETHRDYGSTLIRRRVGPVEAVTATERQR